MTSLGHVHSGLHNLTNRITFTTSRGTNHNSLLHLTLDRRVLDLTNTNIDRMSSLILHIRDVRVAVLEDLVNLLERAALGLDPEQCLARSQPSSTHTTSQ